VAAGRPTDYTPTLGAEILTLMAEGLSLAAAAADLGIHRQRVYDWEAKHPEFADTIKLARAKRQLFLERRLLSSTAAPIVTSTIFALKNAAPDDWRDKSDVEHGVTNDLAELLARIDGRTRTIIPLSDNRPAVH
jgi:transposase